jgi:hypothetical protein
MQALEVCTLALVAEMALAVYMKAPEVGIRVP